MHRAANFSLFCQHLQQRLQRRLPGFEAQQLMEPPTRRHLLNHVKPNQVREGAVLIPLFQYGNGINTIMIRRALYNGVHSGQIAFPGGRRENADKSLVHTAVREACEEVGLVEDEIKVLGSLSRLYIPPSNFDVLPVVAALGNIPKLKIQPEEVNEAFFVPLAALSDKSNCKKVTMDLKGFSVQQVPAIQIENKLIWGATAMIISELLHVLEEIPSP